MQGITMVQAVNTGIDESVSKRINVTLPDSVVEELEQWADNQGRSLANLAAFLLEASLKEAKAKGEIPTQELPSQQKKPRSDK
jgi:CopG-like RHH_1 or ribbon-helix-helix domain, RHH_5